MDSPALRFLVASAAARAIVQRQIDVTDQQIDALVYDLYGLSADEIAIVETVA